MEEGRYSSTILNPTVVRFTLLLTDEETSLKYLIEHEAEWAPEPI
jgi:hypothetical protein